MLGPETSAEAVDAGQSPGPGAGAGAGAGAGCGAASVGGGQFLVTGL